MPADPDSLSYFIRSMRVRRVLEPRDADTYRCLTYAADDPQADDIVLHSQYDFDNVLIRLGLMWPRSAVKEWFEWGWRRLKLDGKYIHRPSDSGPSITIMPILHGNPRAK